MKQFLIILYLLQRSFFRVNWLKTFYFNFRMFPFNIARKLPVMIYGKCRLVLHGGKIILDIPVKRGVLKIGHHYEIFDFKEPSQIKIQGVFILKGEVWLGTGVSIFVASGACLTMGELSSMGSCGSLICKECVTFSDYARVGSFSFVSDCNYHYMKNIKNNSIRPITKPVRIGIQNYIGSKVSLLPGTITPNNITIGFGSVCNKDYTKEIPENSVIAGMPAKLVKENVVRIFDFEKEAAIHKYFLETGADVFYDTEV